MITAEEMKRNTKKAQVDAAASRGEYCVTVVSAQYFSADIIAQLDNGGYKLKFYYEDEACTEKCLSISWE